MEWDIHKVLKTPLQISHSHTELDMLSKHLHKRNALSSYSSLNNMKMD